MKPRIDKKQFGFTLIEMLVVISIIVTLTSVVLANFSSLSQSRNLNSARDQLLADLRRMQISALASKNSTNGNPSSSYTAVFDYASNPGLYTLNVIDNQGTPVTTLLNTVTLPNRISISAIGITTSGGAIVPGITNATIYFTTPYSRVLVSYPPNIVQEKDDTITLTLSSADGHQKQIIINGTTGNISAP